MRTIKLCYGLGQEGRSHCVMAATSIVAGESFSDEPSCVCPAISDVLIAVNDGYGLSELGAELRTQALGHLPWMIIGTYPDIHEVTKRRRRLIEDYIYGVRVHYGMAVPGTIVPSFAAGHATYSSDSVNTSGRNYAGLRVYHANVLQFIDFLEKVIIPMHTTMPVEPGFNIEKLCTAE